MLLLLSVAAVLSGGAEPMTGRASVIYGDTLEIHGQRIRLWGVDAPEARQPCRRGGQTYRCGQSAANALSDYVGQRTVICSPVGRPDRYRRIVARCSVAGSDLGGWMVRQGWALDYPRYSGKTYEVVQVEAKNGRKGLWAGEFQAPWEWRRSR